MIVASLVLGAVLLAITGIVVSLIPPRRAFGLDDSEIRTAAQLDTAMAIQRSMRIAELQRRMADRRFWPCALFGLAFLMQMTALAVDRLAHPSITAITILPAFFIVMTARAARLRDAQRQLGAYLKSESSSPIA